MRIPLILGLVAAGVALGYGLAASPSARPVVRRQFIRELDPRQSDLWVPSSVVISDLVWRALDSNQAPSDWTLLGFDDSSWPNARSLGGTVASEFGLPQFPIERIWQSQKDGNIGDHNAALRRTFFTASPAPAAILVITCDNEFRAWLDGSLVGEGAAGTFPVPLSTGVHVLAVEGIDRDTSTIGMGCALLLDPDNPLPLEGLDDSRWAIFDLPGLSPQNIVTTRLQRLSDVPGAEDYPALAGMREVSEPLVPIFGRPGRLLVPLFPGYGQSFRPLPRGFYRLIVDSVE
jgi:hypothetical protein